MSEQPNEPRSSRRRAAMPDPADDVKNVMKQIESLNLPPPADVPTPPDTPPEPERMVALPVVKPCEPVKDIPSDPVITHMPPGGHIIKQQDVVQIVSKEGRLYGVFFIVGDVRGDKVHGFYLEKGGKKEFVTVNINDCALIGRSTIYSREPVSQAWLKG